MPAIVNVASSDENCRRFGIGCWPLRRRSYSRASRNDTQGQYCQKHFHCFMMPHRLSPLFDVRIGSLQKAACEDLSN